MTPAAAMAPLHNDAFATPTCSLINLSHKREGLEIEAGQAITGVPWGHNPRYSGESSRLDTHIAVGASVLLPLYCVSFCLVARP